MASLGRRAFLQLTGLSATAAAVAACGPRTPAASGPSTTVPPPTATPSGTPGTVPTVPDPTPIDYRALSGKLSGKLVLPGQAGYDAARRSYNPLYDGRRPGAIAQVARLEDVQACVEAAMNHRAPIAARSGGHSYVGYSTPDDALVVDLAGLSDVRVNPDGTAVIGAGAKLLDVYTALAAAGRALPGGSCPTVGIAGLTLGGGIGVLSREYGLTCDLLTSATMVSADGTARTAAGAGQGDGELFWALRGGGGGNFGIVTSFTFKTVPAPANVTVFVLGYPAGAAADVYAGWQAWIARMPDRYWANVNITGAARSTVTVVGLVVGTPDLLTSPLSNLDTFVGRKPSSKTVIPGDYLSAMRYFAGVGRNPVGYRESFVASSRMIKAPLSDPTALATAADGRPDLHVIIDPLGGQVSGGDGAFPYRNALASVQIYLKTTAAGRAHAATEVAAVRDRLGAVLGESAYVNYLDATMPNWGKAYYGDSLPRLKNAALVYDPSSLFTFPQAVNRA